METLIKSPSLKDYCVLTKPGIIFGNAVTAIGGFLLASRGNVSFPLFLITLLSLSLIIGSGCALNNYMDRFADKKMERTQNRALAKGLISPQDALIFAGCLGVLGTVFFLLFTNLLTTAIALIGFVVYVLFYSFLKYHTEQATLIGSIAGAVPPVVGYCAVSNQLDLGALILFTIVTLWQMPHFFAIALYRLKDYTAAAIPVLPAKKGSYITKIHMMAYIVAFIIAAASLTLFGYTGQVFLITATSLGIAWLMLCIKGFKCDNDEIWAKLMFRFSLVVIMGISIAIPLSLAS